MTIFYQPGTTTTRMPRRTDCGTRLFRCRRNAEDTLSNPRPPSGSSTDGWAAHVSKVKESTWDGRTMLNCRLSRVAISRVPRRSAAPTGSARSESGSCVSGGIGLAEASLGLPGFRVLAVPENDDGLVIAMSRPSSSPVAPRALDWLRFEQSPPTDRTRDSPFDQRTLCLWQRPCGTCRTSFEPVPIAGDPRVDS